MTGVVLHWRGARLEARASGALWWPAARRLVVADLHLGKAERMARRGGPLLPPYEGAVTVERLAAEVAALDPAQVVSLGDGFDDDAAARALPADVCAGLAGLAAGRDWVWVSGNHDPGSPCPRLPGRSAEDLATDGIALRHIAAPGAGPDISGHYHPCTHLAGQRLRCFLIGPDHLILPAFGAYTGGLPDGDPVLAALVPTGLAVACGAGRAIPMPVRAPAPQARRRRG